jgi:hypothetical protein
MSQPLTCLTLLALACAPGLASNQADWVRVWESQGQPNPDATIHGAGFARGAYGLSAVAWVEAGAGPWSQAHIPGPARDACERYLDLCRERLRPLLGREPTFPEVYAAYRYGVTGFKKRYGLRVSACPASFRAKVQRYISNPTLPR